MSTTTPEVRTGYMRDVVRHILNEIEGMPHEEQIGLVWDVRSCVESGPLDKPTSERACAIVDRLYGLAPKLTRDEISSAVAGAVYAIEEPNE